MSYGKLSISFILVQNLHPRSKLAELFPRRLRHGGVNASIGLRKCRVRVSAIYSPTTSQNVSYLSIRRLSSE